MRRIFQSEQGSTSILVVIFMIVLMIFGLSILTTSLSNTRLAEKKRQWLTEYYALEGQVSKELAEIDLRIDDLKAESIEASKNSGQNLNRLFSDHLLRQLAEEKYSLLEVDQGIQVIFDVSEEDQDIPKHIYVELLVPLPEPTMNTEQFERATNFEILAHTEWQEPFDLDQGIKFEDPFNAPENP